jgi:Raf kinase inhibitor-like YbhB/YbcL family protein
MAREPDGFDRHTWLLARALLPFLNEGGYWQDNVLVQQAGLRAASGSADRAGQACAYHGLGIACAQLGQLAEAHRHLHRARRLWGEIRDSRRAAAVDLSLCQLADRRGDFGQALRHATGAFDSYQSDAERLSHHAPGRGLSNPDSAHPVRGPVSRPPGSDEGVKVIRGPAGYEHTMQTDLHLSSPAFADQAWIPDQFSRQGGNVSPPLEWSPAPTGAAELMLWCEDPDAPSGPFLHWLVTGINPRVQSVGEGHAPDGAREWQNDFGQPGWGGPQPPAGHGTHHYVFHVCALDHKPELPTRPRVQDIHRAAAAHELGAGTLTALFSR